jgi:arylsulfatase
MLSLVTLAAVFPLNLFAADPNQPTKDARPNIVLIMVDDLGFSDLGCYGSEIETPNLNRLASDGLRFSQFYNCAKCETTRSTLLSGRYYPEVKNQKLADCLTIAEAMKQGGYTTIMTGKWHLESDPVARGFDHYFGHLSGATNYFTGDDTFRLETEPFAVPQTGFYTTDANTDYAIKFLEATDREKPFFLYIAYNAPHYPLQAPREDVEKYLGRYLDGWDKLRNKRFARQKKLGLFPDSTQLTPRPSDVPAWDSLSHEQQQHEDLMMATYAAMIDRVDQNVGRLVKKLDELKITDNTLIMFLSDNGACPFQRSKPNSVKQQLKPWDPASYWTYDKGWAHACNTPFREYKQNQHEGGIATPFIAHWPEKIRQQGGLTTQSAHLVDIMATCLDVGQIDTSAFGDDFAQRQRGLPLTPIFGGGLRKPHDQIFFSFYGKNNALRAGDWKLVNIDSHPFELYDLARDRTEMKNLAASQPEKLAELKQQFDLLAAEIGEPAKPEKQKSQKSTADARE